MIVFAQRMQLAETLATLVAREWPAWLPLLVGGLAVFLLLPRPRPYPGWIGGLAGLIALGLGGTLLLKPVGVTPESVLFYSFAALAVVSGALLATQERPARAALSFTLVILTTSGLFLLLAAPFLMAATIIVYAGAIIVTFLFVIMLAQQEGPSDADTRSREPALAVLTGFLLLGVILHVVRMSSINADIEKLLAEAADFKASGQPLPVEGLTDDSAVERKVETLLRAMRHKELADQIVNLGSTLPQATDEEQRAAAAAVMDECRRCLLIAQARGANPRPRAELPMSPFSGPPANTLPGQIRRNAVTQAPEMPADNAAALGRSLFTDYLLPVELGGFLLLVATVGAVAIAQRKGDT